MNEILKKLKKVQDSIISDDKFGKIFLFAIIERVNLENKWDIVISAERLTGNNEKEDLTYVIEQLKKEFENDLGFLSQIVLTKSDDFVKDFARALNKVEIKEGEVLNLKLLDNFIIKHAYVISSDFSTLDLTIHEKKEIKEKNDFFI